MRHEVADSVTRWGHVRMFSPFSMNASQAGLALLGRQGQTLPAEEKKLWHSHVYEVKSGQLVAPGIPQIAEHAFMQKIAGTYGKTWHTWHTDQQRELPTGQPLLMMGFTADGQINPALVEDRDKRFKISSDEKKNDRANLNYPAIDPDADSWHTGKVLQLSLGPLTKEALAAMQGDHAGH